MAGRPSTLKTLCIAIEDPGVYLHTGLGTPAFIRDPAFIKRFTVTASNIA